MLKYSEGEWEAGQGLVDGLPGEHYLVGVPSEDIHKIIAPTGLVDGHDKEESLANAYLIAAAPNMYEALRYLYQAMDHLFKQFKPDSDDWPFTDYHIEAHENAGRALAKAEGKDGYC